MSQKERDRLKVLHEANQRHLTQKQAAGQMGVSERWVRKLLARMRKEGDRAVIHRLRGRCSNRKISEPVGEKAVGLVRKEYGDFGPHAGQRVSGGAARDSGEPGDAAGRDDPRAVVEAPAGADQAGAHLAAAALATGRAGAVGHQRA
ncbi:MAG: helix-turn-helix domain-containing protein [Acidobacteria bacterium]|nr:helix-turn-helix domain-containing protein [Acidobacteriota bacterium]